MKVKVCGVTRAEDAELACRLGAWAVGLIFVASSPRVLTPEKALAVREAVTPGTLAVGVFADQPVDQVRRIAELCRLDAVQLHGAESPEYCARLAIPVYKAHSVADAADLAALGAYRVAGHLVETVRRLPAGREKLAPSERVRRWELAGQAKRYGFLMLAGELDPVNVRHAVAAASPDAVDVAGGVESSPGVKDAEKVRAFFGAANA